MVTWVWVSQDCSQTAEESEEGSEGVHGDARTGAGAALTSRATSSPFYPDQPSAFSQVTSHLQTLQLGKAATAPQSQSQA